MKVANVCIKSADVEKADVSTAAVFPVLSS
jgi:hypothetical protein